MEDIKSSDSLETNELPSCERELTQREDEVQEEALQLPAAGLSSLSATDGPHQCVLPQINHESGQRGRDIK
jgi:hypothetical protein